MDKVNHEFWADESKKQSFSFSLVQTEITIDNKTEIVPKKLGDGNFGMVFDAVGVGHNASYAVKILYAHRAPDEKSNNQNKAHDRVHDELSIGVTLPNELQEFVKNNNISDKSFLSFVDDPSRRLVLPIAYSKNFDDFVGKSTLEKVDIQFSSYAYIMEKFECSLKDLVEGKKKPDLLKNSSSEMRKNVRSGYAKLTKCEVIERERSAVAIIEQIAQGLQILHAAGLRHQDIKPANVYFKQLGNEVQFRLGDLGFLRPQDPVMAGSTAGSLDDVGIGTKHYRSIEQIDFTDTAECDVVPLKNGTKAKLVTNDPKFLETNIQIGDLAFFAKSGTHRLMRIEKFERVTESNNLPHVEMEVALGVPRAEENNNKEPDFLVSDNNTQVCFVKNPTAKTDLFGLAGILYDIVTPGKSPERFYELLRRFDRNDCRVEGNILVHYDSWKAGTLDDADIGAIFNRINNGESRRESVSEEILSFVVKCMMSEAKGSYYQEFGFYESESHFDGESDYRANAVNAWSKILNEIRELEVKLESKSYREVDRNVLTRSTSIRDPIQPDSTPLKLEDVLIAYRNGKAPININHSQDQFVENLAASNVFRWIMSAKLLGQITRYIGESREKPDPDAEMIPLGQEHFKIENNSITPKRPAVKIDESSLISSLRSRDPLLTRIRPFSNRFEPLWWQYGARRIYMEFDLNSNSGSNLDQNRMTSKIRYADFSFSAKGLEMGDFILPHDASGSIVFVVKEIKDSDVTLDIRLDKASENGLDELHDVIDADLIERARHLDSGYLVKKPDTIEYYGGMLGIYLYHFLISNGAEHGEENADFPAHIYAALREFPVSFKKRPSFGTKDNWENIKHHTIELIVWLTLGGFCFEQINGNTKAIDSMEKRWMVINDEMIRWRNRIYEYAESKNQIDSWSLLKGPSDLNVFISEARIKEWNAIDPSMWYEHSAHYIDRRGVSVIEKRSIWKIFDKA